jgi:hypothetical protein
VSEEEAESHEEDEGEHVDAEYDEAALVLVAAAQVHIVLDAALRVVDVVLEHRLIHPFPLTAGLARVKVHPLRNVIITTALDSGGACD